MAKEDYVFVWSHPDTGECAQLPRPKPYSESKKKWWFGEAYLDYIYCVMSLVQFVFLRTP